jgi:hypothetical protein
MRTALIRVFATFALATLLAAPASAQGFTFNLGYFQVKGADSRPVDDVWVANLGLNGDNDLPLFFETNDFNGAVISGEFFVPIGDFIEVAGGLGFYQKTVLSVYDTVTFPNGDDIFQDLKLRVVPITGTVKFLPLGKAAPIQPYVGGGIGLFSWRYSEIGDFVDGSDGTIFSARYIGDGLAVGPVILGGVRFPFSDRLMSGAEVRWQKATGDLPEDVDFLAPKIDLGGWAIAWTLSFK